MDEELSYETAVILYKLPSQPRQQPACSKLHSVLCNPWLACPSVTQKRVSEGREAHPSVGAMLEKSIRQTWLRR